MRKAFMFNGKNAGPAQEWEDPSIRPVLLGRKFCFNDDPEIFTVLGLKGKSDEVVVQGDTTEEIRTMPRHAFAALATCADK